MLVILKRGGSRVTPQLEGVLDYLLRTTEHPSAQKIFEVVRRKVPRISLATVYNILHKLDELNLIGILEFDNRENRYDGDTSPHWNLVCTDCGAITDFRPVHTLDREQIRQAAHFDVVRCRFELHGICEECGRRRRSDAEKPPLESGKGSASGHR